MKFLKIVALSYALKTLLFGAAWLLVPDLPQRAATALRQTWSRVFSAPVPGPPQPSSAVEAAMPAALPTTR